MIVEIEEIDMLKIKGAKLFLNDSEYVIRSGAIHYFRVPSIYWEDRLKKLKECGLNTVETYVAWSYHEEIPGQFDFTGERDFKKFIKIAENLGLNVILRPGPYICAEYDFGGLPYWLLKDRNIKLRTYDEQYLSYVERYLVELYKYLHDCFSSQGGNIIAVQVENEYGSYGNSKEYLEELVNINKKLGIKEILFTSDGIWNNMISGGTIQNILPTFNTGVGNIKKEFTYIKSIKPNIPYVCMEYWCGWFSRWGQKAFRKNIALVKKDIRTFLENGISFNLYMFHGGTNFGFDAGANYQNSYTPTTTSYDYYAPVSEDGSLTELYHAIKEVIYNFDNKEYVKKEYVNDTQKLSNITFNQYANLFDNLDFISNKTYTKSICSMEDVNQRHGLILYSKVLEGDYSQSIVTLEDVHDNAYIYIDGMLKKVCYRIEHQKNKFIKGKKISNFKFILPAFKDKIKIDILVESYGRINYGRKIGDRKGLKNVLIGNQYIYGWEIYSIPLIDISSLKYAEINDFSIIKYPAFIRGCFECDSSKDLMLKLPKTTKGYIFINNKLLGRYNHIGPQKEFYVPKNMLKVRNEIVLLETDFYTGKSK